MSAENERPPDAGRTLTSQPGRKSLVPTPRITYAARTAALQRCAWRGRPPPNTRAQRPFCVQQPAQRALPRSQPVCPAPPPPFDPALCRVCLPGWAEWPRYRDSVKRERNDTREKQEHGTPNNNNNTRQGGGSPCPLSSSGQLPSIPLPVPLSRYSKQVL